MKSNLPLRWQSALQGKQWLYHHSQLFLSKDVTSVDLQYMNQYINEQECCQIPGNSTQTSFFCSSGSDATTSSSPRAAILTGNGRQHKPRL